MSLIPDEELRRQGQMNLAPMVDFLFLVLAIFATLAITRTTLFDAEVDLVKVNTPKKEASSSPIPAYVVNISVTEKGQYKWITENRHYIIDGAYGIQNELVEQQQLGLLPQEKEKIRVLLHIDKRAQWETIAQAIFAVREAGFDIHPVYENGE